MRIRGRDVPLPYAVGLTSLVVVAVILAATSSGLVDIESLYFFLLGNTLVTISIMALATVGGAFVGMLAGHHIFASRSFTPFERKVIQALEGVQDVSAKLDDVEARLGDDVADLRDEVEELRARVDALLEERQAP